MKVSLTVGVERASDKLVPLYVGGDAVEALKAFDRAGQTCSCAFVFQNVPPTHYRKFPAPVAASKPAFKPSTRK